MPFSSVTNVSPTDAEEKYHLKTDKHLNSIYKCIAEGFTFIIDAKSKKLLLKTAGELK